MANGNGNGTAIDRWGRLVMQLGVPTVFAGVLLWFVLSKVAVVLDAIVVQLQGQTSALQSIESHIGGREHREAQQWEERQERRQQPTPHD